MESLVHDNAPNCYYIPISYAYLKTVCEKYDTNIIN